MGNGGRLVSPSSGRVERETRGPFPDIEEEVLQWGQGEGD